MVTITLYWWMIPIVIIMFAFIFQHIRRDLEGFVIFIACFALSLGIVFGKLII